MLTITNVSRITDRSGSPPVDVFSNPVQTVIGQNPTVKAIPYSYDLSRYPGCGCIPPSCVSDCGCAAPCCVVCVALG